MLNSVIESVVIVGVKFQRVKNMTILPSCVSNVSMLYWLLPFACMDPS